MEFVYTAYHNTNNRRTNLNIKDITQKYYDKLEMKTYDNYIEQLTHINRELYLDGVDAECASGLELMIRFYNRCDNENDVKIEDRVPIKIFIDSEGGELTACFMIIDAISLSKTPVHTIVIGGAYSAGLLVAISGHKRFCYPNASYLFHEGSVDGKISMDANKFRNWTDFHRTQISRSKNVLMMSTHLTEMWYEKNKNDDVWMLAKDALEHGMVDEILLEYK